MLACNLVRNFDLATGRCPNVLLRCVGSGEGNPQKGDRVAAAAPIFLWIGSEQSGQDNMVEFQP
jgi:hypothetical protein